MDADSLLEAVDKLLALARRSRKSRSLRPIETEMEQAWAVYFRRQGAAFLAKFEQLRGKFEESVTEADWASRFGGVAGSTSEFDALLERMAGEALIAGAIDGARDQGLAIAFDLGNPRAVEYLKNYGADLVSKIDETTRAQLRALITQGVDEGWSYGKLAARIAAEYEGFSRARGRLIAITEAGNAYEFGNFWVVKALEGRGLEMEKAWMTIGDSRVSPGCRENEGDDWIPLNQAHSSGHLYPLRFPGCRCDELYRRVNPEASF